MSTKNENTLTEQKVNKLNDGWKDNWKGDKLGGTIASTTTGALNTLTNAIQLSKPGDMSAYNTGLDFNKAKINNIKNQKVSASNLTELSNFASGINFINPNNLDTFITLEEAGGPSAGEWATGVLGGMASGAVTGSTVAPPWGTIAGSFIGGAEAALGLSSRQADAKLNQQVYSLESQQNIAELERSQEELKSSIENSKNAMLQNQINNFKLHNSSAYGGPLFNHAGDWSNGLTFINEGGTHEQNPFEGVMVGIDQEGTPNLVEEGEVIFGDYVFSNRLKPTKKILADGGFSDKYVDWTFAKIAEDLQKESAERPIDFISNNTLEDMMNRLITFQEMVREKKKSNSYKNGGLVNKFSNGTPNLPIITDPEIEDFEDIIIDDFTPLEINNNIPFLTKNGNKINPNKAKYIIKDGKIQFDDRDSSYGFKGLSNLGRYTPAVVNGISALYNATQKPDKLNYTHFDTAFDYAQNVPTINFTPITGEIKADLVDPNHLLNQHLAERASLNRAIKENARTASAANMSLASAAYSGQRNDAEALLTFDRENWNRKLQANQNNVGVRQYNSQGDMSAQQANMNRGKAVADAAFQNANARFGIDQFNLSAEAQKAQALSQSLGATAEDIAGIANENYWANEIKDNPAFMEYIAMMNKAKNSSKCGGMLTRKRRK